jgi:hypothetical protein
LIEAEPMKSAAELMATARGTLTKWPALWLPPIFMNMAQSLSGIPLTNNALQAVSALTANLGAMIITAGWLAMIGVAQRDERPTYAAFMDGVNRRWGTVLAGSLVFLLLLGVSLAAIAWYGETQYGSATLRTWYAGIEKLTPAEMNAALQPDKLPGAVRNWMSLFMLWLASAAVMTFALIYWQPLAVLRDMPWWKAWLTSVRLVFSRFGQTLGFALLHLMAFVAGLTITAGGGPVLAIFGLTMLLFVSIFFKILYAAVVNDAFPAPGETVNVEA